MFRTHIIPFKRPMATKRRKQVDMNALAHLRLINQLLVTSPQDQVKNKVCVH